nr:carboxypeptidase regulatory-like domain-containing protein [Chitinophagaceae bacterium]
MLRSLLRVSLVCVAILLVGASLAQVTTSSITGIVRDPKGKPLEGATIKAEHQPTGTVYSSFSNKSGYFNLPGVRSGGPYRIEVSYTGFATAVFDNITLVLGDPFNITADLKEGKAELETVVVSGQARRKAAIDRSGAVTNINSRLLQTLPTISRSIGDFTRLTPQANGNNFAGRDGRFNNIQIDGANLNNNFGLSTDPLPGGVNQPISIDAIEEIAVNVSPFDVWQGNFTGAGINVITKSGTNRFKGSVYGLLRTEAMNGARVSDFKLPAQTEQTNQIIGGTLGGPIIKNKLFFFVSGEYEKQDRPGILFSPAGGSGIGNVSATPVDSLRKLSDFMRSRYNYETGVFDNFPNFKTENYKILARIDWNINKVHKLSARYQEMVGYNDVITNATSVPTNPSFTPPGATASRTNLPNARFGLQSMSFYNSIYGFDNIVRSGTLELNSSKGGRWSNQLLGTFTGISTTRSTPSQPFPIIDIFNNNTNNYMSVGYEPFSFNNDVQNDIFSVTNNFKLYRGKHTITIGGWYEQQYVGNMFMPGSQSSYVFRSLDDFINNRAPISYAYTYSLIPNKAAVYSAEMKIAQTALYVQDDVNFSDKFKMTFGLRGDLPIYLDEPLENPLLKSLSFPDQNGQPTNYSTGMWPKSRVLLSP